MAPQLNSTQFNILRTLLHTEEDLTQREIQAQVGHSLGTVNNAIRELESCGYVKQQRITKAGITALEPYRVHNAVIMAAGLSSRFAPISYERPKGTLRVRGEVLIERQIEQLHAAGITDITVVVGYKKEYFFYLIEKYGVRIVVNKEYASRNNNGSLWLVREDLDNTYVCSSDNYFTENPFETYVYRAYYSAVYVAGPTKEWCITTGANDRITGCTVGGEDAWTMLGHVYFDRAFSAKFREILERVYHLPETAPKLWESIFLENIKDFDMVIRKYPAGVINEFDSVDELRTFDPHFIENVDSKAFTHITKALGCKPSEIRDFYPLKQGLTNLSCHFAVGDREYVYRHPGIGTEKIVDRQAEHEAMLAARDLGLDSTLVTSDPEKGWKIATFTPQVRNLDVTQDEELHQAMRMAYQLHHSGTKLHRDFDFVAEGLAYEKMLLEFGPIDVPDYHELKAKILELKKYTDAENFPIVPSHNDFFPMNFLVHTDGKIDLIDWEYAGMSDIAADFATMIVCTNGIDAGLTDKILNFYFDREPTAQEKRHFMAYINFAGWCWYIWALLKEAEGDDVGEWLLTYFQHAGHNIDELLENYRTSFSEGN